MSKRLKPPVDAPVDSAENPRPVYCRSQGCTYRARCSGWCENHARYWAWAPGQHPSTIATKIRRQGA